MAPKLPAQLTSDQKRVAIASLERRLGELGKFDITDVKEKYNPGVKTLELAIDRTLVNIFGSESLDYERYDAAKRLDRATSYVGRDTPEDEIQEGLRSGFSSAESILQGVIAAFREEIADDEISSARPAEFLLTQSGKIFFGSRTRRCK